jgi:ubiquinone/menaquinone biosynthesis C-methylase UbiE
MRKPDASMILFQRCISPKVAFAPESKILDVGCKDACFFSYLKSYEKQRKEKIFSSYMGIDIEEEDMQKCRRKETDLRGFYQVGDLTKCLPFGIRSFDLVFCIGTIHIIEFSDFEKAIENLFFLSKKQVIFNFLHFKNEQYSKEICPKKEFHLQWDYFVHQKKEAEEAICNIAQKYTDKPFVTTSCTFKPEMSEVILGQGGKDLMETFYLFDV